MKPWVPVVVFSALSAAAGYLLQVHLKTSGGLDIMESHCPKLGSGVDPTPYSLAYTGIPVLDQNLCLLVAFFTPALQKPLDVLSIELLAALVAPLSIIMMESLRFRGEGGSTRPIWIGLAMQVLGGGIVIPLYWLFYVRSYQKGQMARGRIDDRLANSFFVGIVFGFIIPTGAVLRWNTPKLIAVWQVFPIYIGLFQHSYLVLRSSSSASTRPVDIPSPPIGYRQREAWWWRIQYIFAFAVFFHFFGILSPLLKFGPAELLKIFTPSFSASSKEVTTLASATQHFLQWDLIFISGSTLLALIWTHDDPNVSVPSIVVRAIPGALIFGPGATCLYLWLLREAKWTDIRDKEGLKSVKKA